MNLVPHPDWRGVMRNDDMPQDRVTLEWLRDKLGDSNAALSPAPVSLNRRLVHMRTDSCRVWLTDEGDGFYTFVSVMFQANGEFVEDEAREVRAVNEWLGTSSPAHTDPASETEPDHLESWEEFVFPNFTLSLDARGGQSRICEFDVRLVSETRAEFWNGRNKAAEVDVIVGTEPEQVIYSVVRFGQTDRSNTMLIAWTVKAFEAAGLT